METLPAFNVNAGRRNPLCKACSAPIPAGELLYAFDAEESFGPVKSVIGTYHAMPYIIVLAPSTDPAYGDVYVNVSRGDVRFAEPFV